MADGILVKQLNAWFGAHHVLKDIDLSVTPGGITAIIGPSGCGKSTFVRCLNRMHEVVPGARATGTVLLEGEDLYAQDPVLIRRRVGMVFQKPNPFPTMSVFENVVAGLRLAGFRNRHRLEEAAERSLRQAARVSEWTAFFLMGEVVEVGMTKELFTTPREPKTEAYITGRFG